MSVVQFADSDHVVIMDDELQEIAKELVRNDLLGKHTWA